MPSLVDFGGYTTRYRLFRNLFMLNFQILSLKIGQRIIFANTRAGTLAAAATAAAAAAAAAAASSGIELQLGQPMQHPNELLTLLTLRCLGECYLACRGRAWNDRRQ
ncbi:hypothetical protein KI688_010679 [Linnemannia hyalina]|uniref:Uncharacterized protein n=1 Tax=Linnemannia hyalina TaxID=64524 RepID=A0A9P8BUT0_9FUNG|nr:hypothetical protein KI688_010679 [Linnemannia hyalina]